jgi:hypothetical protein
MFRTRTYNTGGVDTIWELTEDVNIKGYYLYYSKTSGVYMHRKDIGNTNVYRFSKNFFKGDNKIFFAIQAYAENGVTSDFSDETSVIVGNEGTESHPFFEQIHPNLEEISRDEKTVYYPKECIDGENTEACNLASDITNKYKKYPSPNINTQSGFDIHVFLLLMGVIMFFILGFYTIFYKK